ncbi:MAG: phage holin family protein [Oscillospiraceae bacterium]|nr:phage holin family protein [Oscillospiraceae bacterium]
MERLSSAKAYIQLALSVLGGWIAKGMGGWDSALGCLLLFISLDYVTGTLVAAVFRGSKKTDTGALSSAAGFKGICKKLAVLFLVAVAHAMDTLTGSGIIRNACVLFFIGNEGISILENIGLMGVPLPGKLKEALDILKSGGNN